MPFPDSQRVIYGKNPLVEVICQIRFPPILRIDAQVPAEFQELVRAEFPNYQETPPIPANFPPQLAGLLSLGAPEASRRGHQFATADNVWAITLAKDFVALKTSRYNRWEEFFAYLGKLIAALDRVYKPAYYSRIGLRYVDVVQRSRLGLEDKPWSALIEPHLAGEFVSDTVADRIEHAAREVSIRLSGIEAHVVIRHGLVATLGPATTTEACFMIDSDFYIERRKETDDVKHILDKFNKKSGNLFRWSIRKPLHEALQPVPVDRS